MKQQIGILTGHQQKACMTKISKKVDPLPRQAPVLELLLTKNRFNMEVVSSVCSVSKRSPFASSMSTMVSDSK